MNYKKLILNLITVLIVFQPISAQNADSYGVDDGAIKNGLFKKENLDVNHSVSFGMSSYSGKSGLMSQSLYTTMLAYKLSEPVTMKLNFGLPIHNTLNSTSNFTPDNIQSLDYFKNIPFDASVTWQPRENLLMNISIMRDPAPGQSLYRNGYYQRSLYGSSFSGFR